MEAIATDLQTRTSDLESRVSGLETDAGGGDQFAQTNPFSITAAGVTSDVADLTAGAWIKPELVPENAKIHEESAFPLAWRLETYTGSKGTFKIVRFRGDIEIKNRNVPIFSLPAEAEPAHVMWLVTVARSATNTFCTIKLAANGKGEGFKVESGSEKEKVVFFDGLTYPLS